MIKFWKFLFFVITTTILGIVGFSQFALSNNDLVYAKLGLQILFVLCSIICWWVYVVISELSARTVNAISVIIEIKDNIQKTKELIYNQTHECGCDDCKGLKK